MTAVVLYAKFPTQTEFCRFGRALPPSETSPDFFPFFGWGEVGAASPEFSFRLFCLRLSACERTGSSGTGSPSRVGESPASDAESESEPKSESEPEPDAGDAGFEVDDEVSDSTASVETSANLRFDLPDTEGFLRGDMDRR